MVASHSRDDVQKGYVAILYLFTIVFAFGFGYGLGSHTLSVGVVVAALLTAALFVVSNISLREVGSDGK